MTELRLRDPRFPSRSRYPLPVPAAPSLRPIGSLDARHATRAEAAQAGASVTVTPVPGL